LRHGCAGERQQADRAQKNDLAGSNACYVAPRFYFCGLLPIYARRAIYRKNRSRIAL